MDEQEAVQAFIDSSGFPLEYAAAAELQRAGFVPHHGRTFEDTNDAGLTVYRDIDVVADLADTRLAMAVHVVVECKHATTPWVVLGGEMESRPSIAAITTSLSGKNAASAPAFIREALGIVAPLDFALVSVKTKNPPVKQTTDPAFDAVRQLLSAARGALTAVKRTERLVIFPILVVDGSLWRYRFGQPVERIDRARLVWWGAPGLDATILDVVSREAFGSDYLLDLRERLVALAYAFHALPNRQITF